MYDEADIELAHKNGSAAGQIALAGFILHTFKGQIPTRLGHLLEKTIRDGYDTAGAAMGMPAEDVALEADRIFESVRKQHE